MDLRLSRAQGARLAPALPGAHGTRVNKSLHRISLGTAFPGFVLHLYGIAQGMMPSRPHNADAGVWPAVCVVAGSILIVVGLAFGALAKRRAVWWSLFGSVPVVGLWIGAAVIHALKDLEP
jgi:hypothetical protein